MSPSKQSRGCLSSSITGVDSHLARRRKESVEYPAKNPAQLLIGQDVGLEIAFQYQARDHRTQCRQRQIIVRSRFPSQFAEHLHIQSVVRCCPGNLKDSAESVFRFGMAQGIELEFKGQDRKRLIANEFYTELSKCGKTLLLIGASLNFISDLFDVRSRPAFEESQEEVFFVFEMGVDRSLTPPRGGGDFIQLGAFKSVPDENFLRSFEKPSLRLLNSKLLFGQRFHGPDPI